MHDDNPSERDTIGDDAGSVGVKLERASMDCTGGSRFVGTQFGFGSLYFDAGAIEQIRLEASPNA